MSAAPKLRFADEAAAVLAELRRAVERIGDDWDALVPVTPARSDQPVGCAP